MPVEPERLPKKIALQELEDWIPGIAKYKLGLKQMRFLAAYIGNDFNGVEAYHACNSNKRTKKANEGGCCNRTAAKKACGMLKHYKIQAALTDYMKAFIGENREQLEYRVLEQLYSEAFYKPSDIIDKNGQLILDELEDYPPNLQKCILSIETITHPKDPTIKTQRVKLADRRHARKELELYANIMRDNSAGAADFGEGIKSSLQALLGNKPESGFKPLPKPKPEASNGK
jgi:hypothetical protein